MKTAKPKGKAGIIGIKLITLLFLLLIPVLKISSQNVTITYGNSGKKENSPINYIVEQLNYSDIDDEGLVLGADKTHISNECHTHTFTLLEKAKGIYTLMYKLPNPLGIFDVKGLSP
jgi:hypothetical protein